MIPQIISGIIIAVISFGLGYFLFTVQRKEAIRLELYKRRLESYDKIMSFLQKVDQEIIAKGFNLDKAQKEKFVLEIYNLTLPHQHYLSKEVYDLLEPKMVNYVDFLPKTASELEKLNEEIGDLIIDEVGSYLIKPKNIRKIIGKQIKKKNGKNKTSITKTKE